MRPATSDDDRKTMYKWYYDSPGDRTNLQHLSGRARSERAAWRAHHRGVQPRTGLWRRTFSRLPAGFSRRRLPLRPMVIAPGPVPDGC